MTERARELAGPHLARRLSSKLPSGRDKERSPGVRHSEPPAAAVLELQRTAGNRAVARQLGAHIQRRGSDPTLDVIDPRKESPTTSGGVATADNLRTLVEIRLEAWKRAAEAGVQLFADDELLNAINESKSFNADNFFTALIGNITWAAACFWTGGTAFAISLAGIAVGAAPGLPAPAQPNPLMTIKRRMLDALDHVHHQLVEQVPIKVAFVLREHPGIVTNDALEMVLHAGIRPAFLLHNGQNDRDTDINEDAVRGEYQKRAAVTLQQYKSQVAPIGTGTFSSLFLCRIKPGGLAIVEPTQHGTVFRHWVDAAMAQAALTGPTRRPGRSRTSR